jgi:hypothetical protein
MNSDSAPLLLARKMDKTVGREGPRQSLSGFTLRGLIAIVVGPGTWFPVKTATNIRNIGMDFDLPHLKKA